MLLRSLVLLLWASAVVVAELPGTEPCATGKCFGYRSTQTAGRTLLQKEGISSQNEQVRESPLIIAAKTGSAAAVRQLLSTGVDVNEIGLFGHTALWEASRRGIPKMVDALLAAGADPNLASENGMTPLYMASEAGSLRVVKSLVKSGANIESASNKGATPILMAAQAGNEDIVEFLIQQKANVNAKKTNSGQSALWSASFFGFQGVVQKLLKAGADINDAEASGATPAYAASQEGQIAALLALIEGNADVTIPTKTGATPLHVAAAACQEKLVGALLIFKAEPLLTDTSGQNPIDSMCRGGYSEDRKSKIASLLKFAAESEEDVTLKDVLDRGIQYEDKILDWIKRLLNPNDIILSTNHAVEAKPVPQRTADRGSRASGSKIVILVLAIISVVVLVVALKMFVFWNSKSSNRPAKRTIPRPSSRSNHVLTLNPLAHLESASMTESVRTIGWLPPWRTPQVPRPTGSRTVDSNPGPLPNAIENSAEFSREQLLEWLKEPQAFASSQRWDLEPQVPEVTKSEGSLSSSHDPGLFSWLSQSFSSLGARGSARKRSDADSLASEDLPGSHGGPSDHRRLWRIDPRSSSLFSSRSGAADHVQKSDSARENERIHSLTSSQLEHSSTVTRDSETPGRSQESQP